jgi:hypothetical protein
VISRCVEFLAGVGRDRLIEVRRGIKHRRDSGGRTSHHKAGSRCRDTDTDAGVLRFSKPRLGSHLTLDEVVATAIRRVTRRSVRVHLRVGHDSESERIGAISAGSRARKAEAVEKAACPRCHDVHTGGCV